MASYNDLEFIGQIVLSGATVSDGMAQLADYCNQQQPDPIWERIAQLDFDASIKQLSDWLTDVLITEPPAADINGFWFGLYNPMLPDGLDGCQLYISGSTTYSPKARTGYWAAWSDDSYIPAKRYTNPGMLTTFYRMCSSDFPGGIESETGEYVLCLGYAALAVAHLCRSIVPTVWLGKREQRAIAIGYDSGDCWVLGTMYQSGWKINTDLLLLE